MNRGFNGLLWNSLEKVTYQITSLASNMILARLLMPTDFGGYTDIARGVGKILGFDLMVNFRTPYVNSTSVTDYWKRNHISLTTWLKDHVFYPFMGTSSSKLKVYVGILIMFVASGIWHGVGWMFIIWGALQAGFLIMEDLTSWDKKFIGNKFSKTFKKIFTYMIISLGLVFFRVPSFSGIYGFFGGIMEIAWIPYVGSRSLILRIMMGTIILLTFDEVLNNNQIDQYLAQRSFTRRWVFYLSMIFLIVFLGSFNQSSFIYYEF